MGYLSSSQAKTSLCLGKKNPLELWFHAAVSQIPMLYEIIIEREENKTGAGSEIQQTTASCQIIISVLHLFTSAKFQGHPSEKLAGEKSF